MMCEEETSLDSEDYCAEGMEKLMLIIIAIDGRMD